MVTALPTTALNAGDPDDGDYGRRQRGLAIAATVPIKKNKLGYSVPSQSGNGRYLVNLDKEPFCNCPDFELTGLPCKHIYGVQYLIQREEYELEAREEIEPEDDAPKFYYTQDWPAYNKAQIYEGDHFVTILREICDHVETPPQAVSAGRPRLPLSDALFGMALKVYTTKSTRRAMSSIRDAHSKYLLDTTPSPASIFKYTEDPDMKDLIRGLIELSALPLQSVDVDFAPDSTGFSSTTYHRWFSHKWGRKIKEARWVKAHIFTGTKTNVVVAADVTDVHGKGSADSVHLIPFMDTAAENFHIRRVLADKGYLSKKNLRAIAARQAEARIPFKTNSVPFTPNHKKDQVWIAAYHYYNLHRAEFLEHYHQRSNVETTFSMIKAKFGSQVRSKTLVARINETLLKILCHNIVVLIHEMYETGLEPMFENRTSQRLLALAA